MPLRAPADARLVAYEVKWDGFRAVVSTEAPLRARSRRGWNMAPQLGFLAELPVRAVLDGEVVAFGSDTKPDFPLICEALLQGRSCSRSSFDVLSVEAAPRRGSSTRSAGESSRSSVLRAGRRVAAVYRST